MCVSGCESVCVCVSVYACVFEFARVSVTGTRWGRDGDGEGIRVLLDYFIKIN